ncbi:DUF5412 family protein [Gorillibacterium timonense]|uniref:DUF5412 family protein n=1 Tax=Gorillibacterium timonense TaxID=1689269 RepID=UPI000A704691|nr:DUF5412 family protein [Gorillibacterium timonense]
MNEKMWNGDLSNESEKERKKVKRKILFSFFGTIAFVICLILYGVYWAFFDLQRIPKGKLLTQQTSPAGTYTVKAYSSDAGATTSYSVVGELNYNKVNKKPKIIYFQNKEESATIIWKDDHTVIINNKELEVLTQVYDYRR